MSALDDALLRSPLGGFGGRGARARMDEHDDRARQVAVRMGQLGKDRRPVGVGQGIVEKHGVGSDRATRGQSFGGGRRFHEPVAVVGVGRQLPAEGTPLGGVVIHD